MTKLNCIALVDDDQTTNFLNKRLIESKGVADKVLIFKNGEEAINHFSKLDESSELRPQLVLLDINMPIMNGFEFLDAYKELSDTQKADQIVVMLSSSEQPNDKAEAQKRGIEEYLSKPLTEDNLKTILEKYYAG